MNKKIFLLLFLSLATYFSDAALTFASATSTESVTSSTTVVSATTTVLDRAVVEKRVREYFADIPVMIDIARCESDFRQFTDSGSVFKGGSARGMVGLFQFFGSIHAESALKLGYDINTVEGNIGYAREIYKNEGTAPWGACVPKVTTTTVYTTTAIDAQTQLRIELMMKLIDLLKQLLALELAGR